MADVEVTDTIHQALVNKGLPPGQHIVDAGYVEAELLLKSQKDYGVSLIGPMRPDNSWQAQAEQGFDISKFVVNWKAKKVTCPQGRVTRKWCPSDDGRGHKIINVRFAQKDCIACPSRSLCTRAANAPRELTLRTQEVHELIQATRQRRHTAQWKGEYDIRAGIEGTLSQAVRSFQLRQSRYRGLAKTHLQHVITAAAINLVRVVAWLTGVPIESSRCSHFAALAATG